MVALVIAAVILVVVGAIAAWATRGELAPMPAVVMIYAVVIAGALVGVGLYFRVQDQRLYDQCVTAVDARDGTRKQNDALYDRLEDRGLAEDADYMRAQQAINLPARSIDECKEP